MNEYFSGIDLTGFWEDSEYAEKEYVCETLSDELKSDIEVELGYKLPESYIQLMQTQNGGLPIKTAVPCTEQTSWAHDHVEITGIMGVSRSKQWSLCGSFGSQFMIDEWGYPPIGIYICDCPSAGHDMLALDYRACGIAGEPTVVHVDQEWDYKITFLAPSFEGFIRILRGSSEFDIDIEV